MGTWEDRIKRFSHESNVLIAAAQQASVESAEGLEVQLPQLIAAAGRVPSTGIKMKAAQIGVVQRRLVEVVVNMLLVRLFSEFHAFLSELAGNKADDDQPSNRGLALWAQSFER